MGKTYIILIVFGVFYSNPSFSQSDSITLLEEIVLSDVKLAQNSEGQFIQKLSDSLLRKNEPLLTSALKFNTPVYFRENGYGMVSSASIRGTGASQTAVVWNGININSQFTGQTDFNTINTGVYDNIQLRPGGGSVIYGSGAIGGTIHLNNLFEFNSKVSNYLKLAYGSFETSELLYNGKFSNSKTSLNINFSGITSDNDYRYPGTELSNENGDFYNYSINTAVAQWLNPTNILKFYSAYYQGDRGFSGTLTLNSNSEYEDRNLRNLVEWKSFLADLTSSLKVAFIKESYKYFENRDADIFSFGEAETAIFKYDLNYSISATKSLNLLLDYTSSNGKGSGIANAKRNTTGISLLWNQDLGKLNYNASLRQEFLKEYKSPLLFSIGANYQIAPFYKLKLNTSRNFRIPTYNDLFWLEGGNRNLKPETSLQAEIGNEFQFKEMKLSIAAYFIDIQDLLRWTPNVSGIWRPGNTQNVHNYGLEVFAEWNKNLGEYPLQLNATYAYTRSIDQETEKQLIYVPEHKVTFVPSVEINNIKIFGHYLYNGSIYTSSDNQYSLDGYSIANLGASYIFNNSPGLELGFQIKNILDTKYQSIPSRIMPGRSFQTSLTFNF